MDKNEFIKLYLSLSDKRKKEIENLLLKINKREELKTWHKKSDAKMDI